MSIWYWIAAVIFFLQLPNPLFWLVLHPRIKYWRGHVRAGYITALVIAWGLGTIFLVAFHRALFSSARPPEGQIGIGLALIALDLWLFGRVRRDLGTPRLIGKAELCGSGEVARAGVYAHIRHPRYTGMIASVLGACLLAASRWMWLVAAAWFVLVMLAIAFEERELRARFGETYADYCRSVPRFVPVRTLRRSKSRTPGG